MPHYVISLSQDEINAIINLLAEHPFKLAAPLIQTLRAQALAQIAKQEQADAPPVQQPTA